MSYVVFIFILLYSSANSLFQPKETYTDLQTEYISNLLKTYENFTFVFHVEDASYERVYATYELYRENVHQTALIYNYDGSDKENIIRQFGARFLNLVIMEDIFKFERFSKEPGRMAVNDIVLLFLDGKYIDRDIEKWVRMGQHRIIGNVLILDLRVPNWIALNSTLFYSVKRTKIRDTLQTTNFTEVNVPKKLLLTKDFNNLMGQLLHVGFVDYFPYIYCLEYENLTTIFNGDEVKFCKRAVGAEAELLKVLSERMNFSYKLVSYPGQSHAFIFNKVVEKRVDFVVGGITRTYNRALNATFTISHITEGYTFLYSYKVAPLSYLLIFFYPFQGKLWLFIIFIIILIAVLTYFIINYNSDTDHGSSEVKIGIYKSSMASMNATIEQVVDLDSKYFQQKRILYVLHIIWWFSCIWITTYYKGKLASFYIKPPHKEPTSLQGLIEDGYKIIVNEIRADTIKEIYQYNTDKVIQEAAENTIYLRGLCEVINYTLTHKKSALLTEFGAAKYHSQIMCRDLIGPHKKLSYEHSSLRIVAKPMAVIPHGWPLPKGTPYTFPINMYKLRLRDAGYISQWIRLSIQTGGLWTIQNAQDNSAIRQSNDQVSITLYLSAFLILSVGLTLSSVVFIVELQIKRYTKTK